MAILLLRVLSQQPQHTARGQFDAAPAVPAQHAHAQLRARPATRRVHGPQPRAHPVPAAGVTRHVALHAASATERGSPGPTNRTPGSAPPSTTPPQRVPSQ